MEEILEENLYTTLLIEEGKDGLVIYLKRKWFDSDFLTIFPLTEFEAKKLFEWLKKRFERGDERVQKADQR